MLESMIKKVLLVNPPTGVYDRADRCQAPIEEEGIEMIRPPMDLAYLAAMVEKAGSKAIVKDYPVEGKDMADFRDDLKKIRPDILVLSVTTPTLDLDLKICTIAKKIDKKIITIAKGAHFYEFDKEILSNFEGLDIVIRGEAELTFYEIIKGKDLRDIKGISYKKSEEVIRNSPRPFLADLDKLPFPARHLLNNRLYRFPDTNQPYALILSGRGCPGRCIFCLVGKVSGKKLRTRSVGNVLREIQKCIKNYSIRTFFFRADTFTWEKDWVVKFCQEIITRGLRIRWGTNSRVDTVDEKMIGMMRKAGCDIIGFGIESGSQTMLDKMKKGITLNQSRRAVALCNQYGIKTLLFFILGLPWDTKKTIRETIDFAKELPGTFYNFGIAYPFPGTEFAEIAKKNNLLAKDSLYGFNYARPIVKTFSLTNSDLIFYRRKALKSVYFRLSYVFKILGQVGSVTELVNYFSAGIDKAKKLLLRR